MPEKRIPPVIISKKCTPDTIVDPYMTETGLPTDVEYGDDGVATIVWSLSDEGTGMDVGDILRLCWCGFSTGNSIQCTNSGFSIEAGRLFVVPAADTTIHCYAGAMCSTFVEHTDRPPMRYFLSKDGRITGSLYFTHTTIFFQKTLYMVEGKSLVHLQGYMTYREGISGRYYLSTLHKNSENAGALIFDKVDQRFRVNVPLLKRDRYYLPIFSQTVIKLKAQSCGMANLNTANARYEVGGFKLGSGVLASEPDICWCKPYKNVNCTKSEDYKIRAGKVFASGFVKLQYLVCDVKSFCEIRLRYLFYYQLIRESDSLLPANSIISIQKNGCKVIPNDPNILEHCESSNREVIDNLHDIFTASIDLHFVGVLKHDKPGKYAVCYIDKDKNKIAKVSDINLRGIYEQPRSVAIYLGKPFPVTLRGHHMRGVVGFLSTDAECRKKARDERFDVEMTESPDSTVTTKNITLMIWNNVVIIRNATGRSVSTKNTRPDIVTYHMCVSTGYGIHKTGLSYTLLGPNVLHKSAFDGPRGFVNIPNLLRLNGRNHLLVVTFLYQPSKIESCESNDWVNNAERLTFSVYHYNRKDAEITLFPTLLYSANTYICWCIADACTTLSNFRVSLYIPPDIEELQFQTIMAHDLPRKASISGYYNTFLDRIKFVDSVDKCGATNTILPKGLFSNSGITTLSDERVTYDSMRIIGHAFLRTPSEIKIGDTFKWYTQLIPPLDEDMFRELRVRLCYCSFLANNSCEHDADYTDWVGAIVNLEKRATTNEMILRLSTYSADIDRSFVPCDPDAPVKSVDTAYYRVRETSNGIGGILMSYLKEFRKNRQGFFIEICRRHVNKNSDKQHHYEQVFGSMRAGFYGMQKLYFMAEQPQEVVIFGCNVRGNRVAEFLAVKPYANCSTLTSANVVARSRIVRRTDRNSIIFSNIKINEAGTYKLCLRYRSRISGLAANKKDKSVVSKDVSEKSEMQQPVSTPNPLNNEAKPSSKVDVGGTQKGVTSDIVTSSPASTKPNLNTVNGTLSEENAEDEILYEMGGIIKVVDYRVFCIADVVAMAFNGFEGKPLETSIRHYSTNCVGEWYENFSLVGVLPHSRVLVLADCTNITYAMQIPDDVDFTAAAAGLHAAPASDAKINELPLWARNVWVVFPVHSEMEQVWITCKEFKNYQIILFLGATYVYGFSMPLRQELPAPKFVFKHQLLNPMDITYARNMVIISDEFTRTLRSFPPINISDDKLVSTVLRSGCYHNALYYMHREKGRGELYALDASDNTLKRYAFSDYNQRLELDERYNGIKGNGGVAASPIYAASSLDGYIVPLKTKQQEVLIIGESTTGRMLVLKADEYDTLVYKEINTNSQLHFLNVYSNGWIMLSMSRFYQGQMRNCLLNRTIGSYVTLSFQYNLMTTYLIGNMIQLDPVLHGDSFDAFEEDDEIHDDRISLKDSGLNVDYHTGTIRGVVKFNDCNYISIKGGNFLRTTTHTFLMCSICPPSHFFNKETVTCEQCTIGTYRNEERTDSCFRCSDFRENSTTLTIGGRTSADCLCDKQFYLKDGKCVPCAEATFKDTVSNAECTGTCGPNRSSILRIVDGKPEHVCLCNAMFYDFRLALDKLESFPEDFKQTIGMGPECVGKDAQNLHCTLPSADECVPCPVGYYCLGQEALPQRCKDGSTTQDTLSSSPASCVCAAGHGYCAYKGCIPCTGFGYKDTIDNSRCKACHSAKHVSSLLPPLPSPGPIRVVTEAEWDHELQVYRRMHPTEYKTLLSLLESSSLFANSETAGRSDDCKYCVGGTFFDINLKICLECPHGRFCPGADAQPSSCGSNGITRHPGSMTAMDCYCARGYGNLFLGRHPTSGAIWCRHCVVGYFQHLEYADYGCLPCPENSSTSDFGAKSIVDCSPDPGYFLSVTKVNRVNGEESSILQDEGKSMEASIAGNRQNMRSKCFDAIRTDITARHQAILLRDSPASCQTSCVENVFCHGYSFETTTQFMESDVAPFKAYQTVVFNGLRFLKRPYGLCTLYFFDLKFQDLTGSVLKNISAGDVISVCRVFDEDFEYRFATKPCPIGHYCHGGIDYMRCPDNSTTIAEGAFALNHCLCLAGYEMSNTSAGVCVPCELGTYKQEIGNVGCRRCPDKFRTFNKASKYITDCACSPGHFAKVTKHHNDMISEATYKRMRDRTILRSSHLEELNYFQFRQQEEQQRLRSINRRGNSHILDLPVDDSDPRYQIESFIHLSNAVLLLPSVGQSMVSAFDTHYETFDCERCKDYHYCPGGWISKLPEKKIHNIPYRCPQGSNVPAEATNATSVTQCLCLPGYRLKTHVHEMPPDVYEGKYPNDALYYPDSGETLGLPDDIAALSGENSENTGVSWLGDKLPSASAQSLLEHATRRTTVHVQCVMCEAGMYKEGQENSTCSGRCMQYATTYGGAVSQKQCFCNYGRYMSFEDTLGSMQLTCSPCMKGAVCPGGLSTEVVNSLKSKRDFTEIQLRDHRMPMARYGYFGAFKDQGVELWSPLLHSKTSLHGVSTEQMDYHACPLEYTCAGMDGFPCISGSTGYLCMNCVEGYERIHFRGRCIACDDITESVIRYVATKWPLWVVASLMVFLLQKKMFYQFVLLKIWLEFCFSMVPYSMFPLNSQSSISRFASYYNTIFGYQQQLFTVFRIRCWVHAHSNYRFSNVESWYIQRFMSVVQPFVDGLVLFLILLVLWILYAPIRSLRRRLLRRYTSISSTSSSVSSYDVNPAAQRKRARCCWPCGLFMHCLSALYYVSFQFICQDLIQPLWCVPIQYKVEPPISVLLYLPTHVCDLNDPLFYYPTIASSVLLGLVIVAHLVAIITSVHVCKARRIYSCGRQKHTLSWDCLLLLRRVCVAMITIFQPQTMSTGSAEKMRMLGSVLITSILLIAHMSMLPFQMRDDNLFNRMELMSLMFNCFTGFFILGSFSYDLHYSGLAPLFASLFYTCVMLWYSLVECGFIADLRPALRRRIGCLPNFWNVCRKLLTWHCHSQITFDYDQGYLVIEMPFSGHVRTRRSALFAGRRRQKVSVHGRRSLCLCVEQSVSRYVMEQKHFQVPLYWEEFLIRYSFAYKALNRRLRSSNVVSANLRVTDMFHPDIFDAGPINPWQLSIAILNVPLSTLVSCYKDFERGKLGALYELRCRYEELSSGATEALAHNTSAVPEMIQDVHILDTLRARTKRLQGELAMHIRNAREGKRVTLAVQQIGQGLEDFDDLLTNEEILEKIEALRREQQVLRNSRD
ncbi:GCC2 and GCC3 domain containing protein, putative [Babesia bigemina]|uniref:GCC2 and GCC3 domain containing protein, putative n=1 Tax=Babesia bigemina TaxID=5866 RepID=A0A061D536_BABBI|nr:GCC2 and GCC3 domain containing protein, putative [Babesia bigemina]CDR95678.1 GCC2 and GCC3 domain containing protein, putative [Babesia bigemina]|eukprot:XP_012767864.1 GCC2 and GCC3 domain containing protein, putative [Babesia bigemina]